MNLNGNINLSDINLNALKGMVPGLVKALPTVVALLCLGIFGYTAYKLNAAINVQPSVSQSVLAPLPKIIFNEKVIQSLNGRDNVNSSVPVDLGNSTPFGD